MKPKSILSIVAIAFLLLAVIFPKGRAVTTKDLLRLSNELKAEALKREKAAQDSFEKIASKLRIELSRLEDSIAVSEVRYRNSEAAMNREINHLNKLKNEIKTINYSLYSDTALLNRLRSKY